MIVSPLQRKLLRDLGGMRGQLITIALVVASGVAAFITTRSTLTTLRDARASFYTDSHFADVFASLRRAPLTTIGQLEAIPGVARVDGRIVAQGTMPLETMSEPAVATVVSLPLALNQVHLLEGRFPDPGHDEQVVISDAFAEAHGFGLDDRLPLVLRGVRRDVRIVGIGLSPEYVIVLSPSDMAMDARRKGVLFMNREAVAAANDLEGAFNDVALALIPGANVESVKDAVDDVLERYGGFGSIARDRQTSHYVLNQELAQLGSMSTQVPPLFLLVAAFLLHVVLSRLVQQQRSQIATLKAVGYTDRQILAHYLQLAGLIVVIGAALGVLLGAFLTRGLVGLYEDYFRFPTLAARVDPRTAAIALTVSSLAGVVGTFTSVRSVLKLSPAEAMAPPAPARYRRGLVDLAAVRRLLGTSARMVLREVRRRPTRTILSALGIAVAVAILVLARFFSDAMDHLANVELHESQRWSTQVAFTEPREATDLGTLRNIPGVLQVEAMDSVPVRARHGHHSRDVVLNGYPSGGMGMQRVLANGRPVPLPESGFILTDVLADALDVDVGDELELEVLTDDRRTIRVPIAGVAAEPFGMAVHGRADVVAAALGRVPRASVALLRTDSAYVDSIDRELAKIPDVLSVNHMARVMETFREQSADNMFVFSLILTLFAATIAVGVVYNNARVSLSTRSRDLASLRVLGYTRAEVAGILLGELGLQVALAIPIGLVMGRGLAYAMMRGAADPEAFRLPIIISSRTYAFATVLTIAAALFSAWLVRRKIEHLDLIGVLKTRE
ncbi:MAG: ABC transporter permease [Deltaproteobacteria bacterium]|nr:ABC transporter permease [Deltaproteobacteria bacterium]